MPTFRCGRFPDGLVHIRTARGDIVDFADGVAVVDDQALAAALRKVPEAFEISEDKPAPKPRKPRAKSD
jgi:lactate dehydrogenase-like 2-hydroxyacid dehydrogenase